MKRLASLILAATAFVGMNLLSGVARGEKDKAPPPPALQAELKLLEGTWQLVSREVDGQKEDLQGANVRATVTGDKYTVFQGDNAIEQGTFRIDPTTSPKAIDVLPESGANKGKTILAVYEVGPEELKMCVAPDGGKRPMELIAKQGSGFFLNGYKRQAPPK